MNEKYIDERVGVWFEFGVHSDGRVDVSDGEGDILCSLRKDVAQKIIREQQKFRSALYEILSAEDCV